jgi:hypothetical protein
VASVIDVEDTPSANTGGIQAIQQILGIQDGKQVPESVVSKLKASFPN